MMNHKAPVVQARSCFCMRGKNNGLGGKAEAICHGKFVDSTLVEPPAAKQKRKKAAIQQQEKQKKV